MKKLLHISLGTHNKGMWSAMDKHFQTMHFDWTPYQNKPAQLNKMIRERFDMFQPDVVFMQIQQDGIITADTAKYMTKQAITVNWTGDVRTPLPEWFYKLGKHISLTLFSNLHDVNQMRKQGYESDFLQVGFDPEVFNYNAPAYTNKLQHNQIVFMGSNYLSTANFPLSNMRYQMVQKMFNQFKTSFYVYGMNWRPMYPEQIVNQQQEASIYNVSKIAINLSHFNYGRYSSDRMYRIMGSGGFCLSHNYEQIGQDFEVGQHVAVWNDIDDLVDKVKYYIKHEAERERITMEGAYHVHENCTWDARFKEFKELLNLD